MSTFKTKRRPDAISKSFTLDSHINGNDPHPQYLLRTDVSSNNINIATSFNTNDTNIAAASTLTHTLYADVTNLKLHTTNTDIHVTTDDKARWNAIDVSGYVTKTELKNVGIYNQAVSHNTASSYDLNNYITQGVYYIEPTGTNGTIGHSPVAASVANSGFLTVTCTGTKLMQMFYISDSVYKRTATYENESWSFGDWQVVLANSPIGSLLFVTGPVTPAGYVDADGSVISKTVYSLLWQYAQTTDYVRIGVTPTNKDKGKYIDIDANTFRVPNLGGEFIRMWTANQTIDSNREHNSWQNCGVPNITGTIPGEKYNAANNFWSQVTGAFAKDPSASGVQNNGGVYADTDNTKIVFDAKNCSTVYQDNLTEARPRNIAVHVCIKAYHGSIVPADAGEALIRTIVIEQMNQYAYATTETMGLVKLATLEQAIAGTNPQTVITPAILRQAVGVATIVPVELEKTYTRITTTANTAGDSLKRYYTLSGTTYSRVDKNGYKKTTDTSINTKKDYYTISATAASGTVTDTQLYYKLINGVYIKQNLEIDSTIGTGIYTLTTTYIDNPDASALSTYYENVVVFEANITYYELDPSYGIKCTALFDINTTNNNYVDVDLSEYGITADDLMYYTVTPMLVATGATNALGYLVGSIVTDPQCAVKPNDQYEELGKLDVVLYNSATDVPYARVYWPLMWYLRKFNNNYNSSNVGAKLFPLVPGTDASYTTSEVQELIKTELTKWTLKLKLSKQ